jgi:hypothetical protein
MLLTDNDKIRQYLAILPFFFHFLYANEMAHLVCRHNRVNSTLVVHSIPVLCYKNLKNYKYKT